MKKEIVKLFALLVLGAAALSGCSIENRDHRGHYDRHHDDRRDHHDNHYRGY
jgi:hypothetical protein